MANIQTIHTKNLRWIDIINPDFDELEWLRQNFRFHELHFKAVAEHQLRPHIDQAQNYDFLVLLFPVYDKKTQEIVTGEVDFFVGHNFLITAHYGQMYTLKNLFSRIKEDAEIRNVYMQRGPGFLLYKVLESLFRRSYPILDHMSQDVQKIESKLFRQTNVDMLYKTALMRKNVIEFRKMMKTHHSVLEKLPKRKKDYLIFPQSKVYYKDLWDYSQDIWDILEALKETVETLEQTNQALATYRLNQITKVISIFSAIVIPATLVAFLFGVSVEGVPFRDNPYGFWIVAGLMILASIILVAIFKIKKWF